MSSHRLQRVLESYVLAGDQKERKKLRESLVPGSEAYYHLNILETLNRLQQNKTEPIPATLHTDIEAYQRNFNKQVAHQFKLKEIFLRYDRADETERQAILEDIRKDELNLDQQWNFKPLDFKKVAGLEQQRQAFPSRIPDSLFPSKKQIIERLQKNGTNYVGVDQCLLEFIDFSGLNHYRFSRFIEDRSQDFPILSGNSTFISRCAMYLNQECFRKDTQYSKANKQFLESLTLQQINQLSDKCQFLTQDLNYIEVIFYKQFAEWLSPGVLMLQSLTKQKEILFQMYKFVQQWQQECEGVRSHLLIQILWIGVGLKSYDLKLFCQFLETSSRRGIVKNSKKNDHYWRKFIGNILDNEGYIRHHDQTPLIKLYLIHFFNQEFAREMKGEQSEGHYKQLNQFILDDFLIRVYNQTRLKAGLSLQNTSNFSPDFLEKVESQVILKFCEYNPSHFQPSEEVIIDLEIKNIQQLYVKVFEINTENYYRKHMAPFRNDVNLDGLLSSYEQLHHYDDPPALSRIRTFQFSELPNRAGLFVLEFIGKGVSSRAVIRKGSLTLIHKPSQIGHYAYILDQNRAIIKGEGVSILLDDMEYEANQNGKITIPFARSQVSSTAILKSPSGFSELSQFHRLSQNYELRCEAVLLPQSLIAGAKTSIMVASNLLCNGRSVSLSKISSAKATIQVFTQHSSMPSTQHFNSLQLVDGKDLILEFTVPSLLTNVKFYLEVEVFNLSLKKLEHLHYHRSIQSEVHQHEFILHQLYLTRPLEGYQIHVRGKNGEPKAGQEVQIKFHLNFRAEGLEEISEVFLTNKEGVIFLGDLEGVHSITAINKTLRKWTLPSLESSIHYPNTIDILQKEGIKLPFNCESISPSTAILVQLSSISQQPLMDKSEYLHIVQPNSSIKEQTLSLQGMREGRYRLILPQNNREIEINVHSGKYWDKEEGSLIERRDCMVQAQAKKDPLKIGAVKAHSERVQVQVAKGNQSLRVHIFAFKFLPPNIQRLVQKLCALTQYDKPSGRFNFTNAKNQYLQSRALGDEERYVYDRKNLPRFLGNTLEKPQLLLKRNFINDTAMEEQRLDKLHDLRQAMQMKCMMDQNLERRRAMDEQHELRWEGVYIPRGQVNGFQNFLEMSSFAAYNLKPDQNGLVIVQDDLSFYNGVLVVSHDSSSATSQYIPLKSELLRTKRLDLQEPFHPEKGFAEVRQVTELKANESFKITNFNHSNVRIVDSLTKVAKFLVQINGEHTAKRDLNDFRLLE